MNEEAHWNGIANRYEDEIFDVFKSDRNKKLPAYFKKYAHEDHSAIDFGCGIGKAFQYLSPRFKSVLATDISMECLNIAKSAPYPNITFKQSDLTKPNLKFPPADFAFCCNVVMLPELAKNEVMFRNIQKSLRPGGAAIFVLPSFESIHFATWRLMEWNRKQGVKPEDIDPSELSYYQGKKTDILQGIMKINGVRTKHYSEPEIQVLFKNAGFDAIKVDKIEYDWNTEFSSPPKWMQAPYPWDWLVESKK